MKNLKTLRPGQLPKLVLLVVAVWAAFAVTMLTGTMLSAQQIETRVGTINTVLPQIDDDLGALALANQTSDVAAKINEAVQPVGPRFTDVVGAVRKINDNAQSIAHSVERINAEAQSINGTAHSINRLVGSIDGRLKSVETSADSINNFAHRIGDRFDKILDRSRSIGSGIRAINHRAGTVIDLATGIRRDIRDTRHVVPQIDQNAHAIARSPVLHPLNAGNPLLAGLRIPGLHLPASFERAGRLVLPIPTKQDVLADIGALESPMPQDRSRDGAPTGQRPPKIPLDLLGSGN